MDDPTRRADHHTYSPLFHRGQTTQIGQLPTTPDRAHRDHDQRLAATRNAFALLVLPTPPPLHVAGHGRQSIPEALKLGLDDAEWTNAEAATITAERFAWITWTQLNETVKKAAAQFTEGDPSMNGTVHRLATEIANSIQRHS